MLLSPLKQQLLSVASGERLPGLVQLVGCDMHVFVLGGLFGPLKELKHPKKGIGNV